MKTHVIKLQKNLLTLLNRLSKPRGVIPILNFIFDFIGELLASSSRSNTLNTQKIDRNIDKLKQYEWFKVLYEDERYHRLFFVNRHIRAYLQSSLRVNRIMRDKEAQHRFLRLLDKQIKRATR
jgi:hypothetical protein